MPLDQDKSGSPEQRLAVHPGSAVLAVDGANLGDPLAEAALLNPGDRYALPGDAPPGELAVSFDGPSLRIAPGSPLGRAGAALHLDTLATFMRDDGRVVEALILVETAPGGEVAAVYLYPLAPFPAGPALSLVALDRAAAHRRFAAAACVSFLKGTRITMADGRQVPIEQIAPGDRVLTRHNGPQQVRWIGHQVSRAEGVTAPIRIAPGALNNAGELRLSPDHRLFVYQREDRLGAGQAEVLIRARQLVNGDSITRMPGGFVDYYQILFDRHEIIYAEGIAAESLLVEPRNGAALPEPHRRAGRAGSPQGREIAGAELSRPDTPARLRAAQGGETPG